MNRNRTPRIVLASLLVSVMIGNSCRNTQSTQAVNVPEAEAATSTQAPSLAKQQDPKVGKLKVPAGFQAEHLYSPSENKQGSWVSMAFDDKGRMIASDQYGSLYRLTLPAVGTSGKPVVEKLNIPTEDNAPADPNKPKVGMGYAQGLLYAFNSLYVMVNHRGNEEMTRSSGLYRLQDTNGDDQYDKVTLLKKLQGE
jgi:hypothetical protein